jgi:hypothetical protein
MMRNGIVSELNALDSVSGEIASGLYPTPTCSHGCVGLLPTKAAVLEALGRSTRKRGFRLQEKIAVLENLQSSYGFHPKTSRYYLNPEFVEWLMGFPTSWTDLNVSGTHQSLRFRN